MAKATTPKTASGAAKTTASTARTTSAKSAVAKPAAKTAVKSGAKTETKTGSTPAARTTTAAKAAGAAPSGTTVVSSAKPVVTAPMMRKKELIERAAERSGVKKKWAKPAIEALLAEMGEALANDRELNLPPLGKVRIQRSKEMANAKVMVLKLRQAKAATSPAPGTDPKDPLAEAAE